MARIFSDCARHDVYAGRRDSLGGDAPHSSRFYRNRQRSAFDKPGFLVGADRLGSVRHGAGSRYREVLQKYVPDLLKDKFQVLLAKYFFVPIIISAFILFAIGGWSMVFWGVFVRVVVGWHTTWFVNSLSHIYGDRPYETTDDSTNNWFVAILTFGEGWHNNHHAFPTSARHGLKWYQFDMNWITIRIFEKLGWAKNIRLFET